MRKKQFGFTLVELLAVIVILAVIALIATPMILRLIDEAQQDALKDSAYGIIEAGNLFYANNSLSLAEEKQDRINFEIINNRFVNVKNAEQELTFKGKVPESGKLQINMNGGTAISICNGKYCACKSTIDTRVTIQKEDCDIDVTTGEIGTKKDDVPVGTVISYIVSKTPPKGYLACDGKSYNISDYPKLAETIKNGLGTYHYFGGDGTKTFAVPDLRGEFLRGTGSNSHESMNGIKEGDGAKVGEHQSATINIGAFAGSGNTITLKSANGNRIPKGEDRSLSKTELIWLANGSSWDYKNSALPMEYTSRPTNTSVLYCIKYE